MNEVEFMKAKSELGAYRKVHYYLSHVVRYFQNLERQHKKPNVSLKHIYSNLPEIFNVVNEKVKEHSEVVQMKDTKLWKHILKSWRLTCLKNVFLHKNWTDPFQWPAITVENLTECGCDQGIAEIFVNNVNVWSRNHWKVGSTVEAWICDQQCWAVGTILQIDSEGGVDRLVIGYDNGTRNIIKKTSKYLRPTIEKREIKKEWCYGLRTIPEDVRGELDGKVDYLQDSNSELESKVLELTLENKTLREENEDMASVLEKYLKIFEMYEADPEFVLDCEERAIAAEEKYEAALESHEKEMSNLQESMQKQIDELRKKLKDATSSPRSKRSKHRIVKRGKTCPTFSTRKRFPMTKQNAQPGTTTTTTGTSTITTNNSNNNNKTTRVKSMQKNRKLLRKHPTTMRKKLPLEPSSFSYLNVCETDDGRRLNKESESGSMTDEEEIENFNHILNGIKKKEQNWKATRDCSFPKSPRFRAGSAPIKSTTTSSSRKFGFSHSEKMMTIEEEDTNVALPTILKRTPGLQAYCELAEAEKKKNNTPNQLCDDLVFLASRVSALQDKLKAYHHSRTRSRSISGSRSRSCSSDSEEIGMEEFISLQDMEKRLRYKREENKTMLEELEHDVREFLSSTGLFPALLSEVQNLKYSFDESYEKIQNGKADNRKKKLMPQSAEAAPKVIKERRNFGMSTAKPPKCGKVKKTDETIPKSTGVDRSNSRKSPAKDCGSTSVLSRTESSTIKIDNKKIDINILMQTMFAGAKTSSIEDEKVENKPSRLSSNDRDIAGGGFQTRRRRPNLSLSDDKELDSPHDFEIPNQSNVQVEEAGEMIGGDIMNSPKTFDLEPEVAPQLAY